MEQKKIGEIKEELKNLADDELNSFIDVYSKDSRSGVQKLVESAVKRKDKYEKELERIYNMKEYERANSD